MPYLAPTSLADALSRLSEDNFKIVAGCTDYFPGRTPGPTANNLLDLTRLEGLRGITATEGFWRIGAATTWSELVETPLPGLLDALKQAAVEVGSVQIQNRGTIGGNICNASPAADGVPPLLAMNAEVEIASVTRTRQVPLQNFITGVRQIDLLPGEMVTAIYIPDPGCEMRSAFLKLGSRTHLVISIAMAAAVCCVENGKISAIRISVGSCAPVAQRLPALEAYLAGRKVAGLTDRDFVQPEWYAPLSPLTDIRGSAGYRNEAAIELCRRVVLNACAGT
ncbi:MAG: FAD binding domain-containing protein [Pseudomonadota bacterium]